MQYISLLLRCSAAGIIALGTVAIPSFAQEETTIAEEGTIIVEQEPIGGHVGKWTLLKPYHLQTVSRDERQTVTGWAGTYTLLLEPPDGASASIRLFRDKEQLQFVDYPQITFNLAAKETLRVSVHYTFERRGAVSISSDPPGLAFTLTGPNRTKETGVTPAAFLDVPEGQYAVEYEQLPGCAQTPVKSLLLEKSGRVSFHVKLTCEAANDLRSDQKVQKEKYIAILVDDKEILLTDVPQNAWFATYVFSAAKGGMITGYKDADGKYTGEFGPERLVTAAELAKMAHRIAGINETVHAGSSANTAVGNAWFKDYFASAEERGWTIYADATIDPLKTVSRGEVLVTLLQALDVPVQWPHSALFTDVTWRTPYAGAIETAATAEVVSGRTDAEGNLTGAFDPSAPVTRAEMAKILTRAADAWRKK